MQRRGIAIWISKQFKEKRNKGAASRMNPDLAEREIDRMHLARWDEPSTRMHLLFHNKIDDTPEVPWYKLMHIKK